MDKAHYNMVEQQIRTWDVCNDTILDVIRTIPREAFVPDTYKKLAYADTNVALAQNQVMLQPREEAKCLQCLALQKTDTVLEIGTGSGYFTALLASLAQQVDSVDIFPEITQNAQANLTEQNIQNVKLVTGNAAAGWDVKTTYDVIVITGALPHLPQAFIELLNNGGRLFAIIGEQPAPTACLFTKDKNGQLTEKTLFEMNCPMLINAKAKDSFVF